ncbi:T-cell surface antigen CD2 [Brachyistius frenatus]|uniref:T-cell surface antigen CD2 n=1 Tax=Brachyistius frenatus TaxID=100188 RepID=UPI0037E84B16
MVGGRLRCLSCFFSHGAAVLLLGLCLHDAEACFHNNVIHKKAGDTVELSSCLNDSKEVKLHDWRYKPEKGILRGVNQHEQFNRRLQKNLQNWNLSVRNLTPQDSGEFSFISTDMNDKQRKSVIITLLVHELITKQPVLTTINMTWEALNKSCTLFLECSGASDSSVNYSWTVGNRTRSDSRLLQYDFREQDGQTNFTCTISNYVSEKSAFKTRSCSNKTKEKGTEDFVFALSVAGGCCLMIFIVCAVGCFCCCKRTRPGSDSNDLTVYAEISDVAVEDKTSSTMKPCSVYETIDNNVSSVTPGPHTVYDKIQLSRVRKGLPP